jgi:hypothetical protein
MLENHSLVRLNAEFFERHKDHAEILSKQERPHLVLVIQVGAQTSKQGRENSCFGFFKSSRCD